MIFTVLMGKVVYLRFSLMIVFLPAAEQAGQGVMHLFSFLLQVPNMGQ